MSETSHYRSCTPEEELELSRVVERDLRERIRELETINADILAAVDQFLRDEGYSDAEVGKFLCPWISKVKEPPR